MSNKPKRGCLYLYADGHAVQLWEKNDKDAGKIEYAELIEDYGPRIHGFEGRLIFREYSGIGALVKTATGIQVHPDNHSPKTKELGIRVVTLALYFKDKEQINFDSVPDILSSEFTYQPDVSETWNPDLCLWGITKVSKVTRKPKPLNRAAKEEPVT